MKKLSLMILFVAVTAMSFGQISATLHNFVGDSWNTMSSNKACGPCHTPHNALVSADAPLWSHDATANAGSFAVYTNTGTLDATVGQPSGVSLKCLGCHDGSVNLNAHVGGANTASLIGSVNPAADLGTDLSNDHPISFTYDAALATADGGLYDPTTTASGLGGNINVDLLAGVGNDQMECSSCHDPHGVTGVSDLLRKDNTNSELCLTCHNK